MVKNSLLSIYQLLDIEESIDSLLKEASDAGNLYETLFSIGKRLDLREQAEVLAELERRLHRGIAERASIGNVLRDLPGGRDPEL